MSSNIIILCYTAVRQCPQYVM